MRGGLIVILSTFACAAAQKPAQPEKVAAYASAGQAKPKGVMRCHMEQETGSNYMERVCTYDEVKDLGDSSIDDAMLSAERRALQHAGPGSGQPYKSGP